VRLEESGADWNCIDSCFWPIGGSAVRSPDSPPGPDGGLPDADEGLSADDRYAATVEALTDASKRFGAKEVVLSMPLSSLLVKVSRTSVDDRDNLAETAGAELGKVSPFPDETPVAGIETVAETDRDLVTMFAALPESVAADIGEAKDIVPIKYSGERIEIVFNPSYVKDPLKAIDDDEITIELNNGSSPAVIRCSVPFLYVMMPLRIN
jgi:hypothetical protein